MSMDDIVTLISDNYGSTGGGGDTPSKIGKSDFGQGDYYRFENFDESILVKRPSSDYLPQGVERLYEKDVETFVIEVASITSNARYKIIVAEVRRICLAFNGDSTYTQVHLNSINEIPHHFYHVGSGLLVAYLNLSHANS